MDFAEITDVTPWIELAHDYGWDVAAEQVANPRIFKSHMHWYDIPKGGKYICAFRHPHSVIPSFYRFLEGWFFETGSISLDEFVRERFTQDPENRGLWHHMVSWWEQWENPDVLLLCYEDMLVDLPGAVRKIARHMEIALDDDLLQIVLRQSSKKFMLAHKSQFDDHLIQHYFAARGGAPVSTQTAKVTSGTPASDRYQLSPDIVAEVNAIWDRMMAQRFGLADYAALRSAVAQLKT